LFLQHRFNLSNPAVEEALHGSARSASPVNRYLAECGITVDGTTIVGVNVIIAPSTSKNSSGKRDP
jgi:hypothetical protein